MLEEIKNKPKNKITREDIANLLQSKGAPGKKQEEKIEAVKELGLTNSQGIPLEQTLSVYKDY